MFEPIEPQPIGWAPIIKHGLLVFVVAPLAGLLLYTLTPLTGAVIGFFATRRWPSRFAAYAWVAGLAIFAVEAWSLWDLWSASWCPMTQWEYLVNSLFGPDCSDSECVYTTITAGLFCSISYSFGAYLALRPKRAEAQAKSEGV